MSHKTLKMYHPGVLRACPVLPLPFSFIYAVRTILLSDMFQLLNLFRINLEVQQWPLE